MSKRFRSRVSVLLLLLIALSLAPIFLFEEPISDQEEAFLAYIITGIAIAVVIVILFAMRYEITQNQLLIKVGPIVYSRLDISNIKYVERSYNPLSSPASSLKRLYIKSEEKDVLISPSNEVDFIRVLKSKNPNITVKIPDNSAWWRFWDWDI